MDDLRTVSNSPTITEGRMHASEPLKKAAWSGRYMERLWLPALGIPMDACVLALAFFCSYWLRFNFAPILRLAPVPNGGHLPWSHYLDVWPVVVVVWLGSLVFGSRLYESPYLSAEDRAIRILGGGFQATLATLAIAFLGHRFADSRLMTLLMLPVGCSLVFAAHWSLGRFHRYLLDLPLARPSLLIVGDGPLAEGIHKQLVYANHRKLFRLPSAPKDEIVQMAQRCGVGEIVLAQSELSKTDLLELAETLESSGVELRIVPSLLELRMGEIQVERSLGVPTLRIHHVSLSGTNFTVKRIFDLLFCLGVVALGAIPFALISLLIKLDSKGPVLFRQKRYGYKGRVFEAYKFRTMEKAAEAKVARMKEESSTSPYFKLKSDPRVTRMGRLLRRFSLDEFPQFINVLKGEMSVVGPRPLATSSGELQALEARYGSEARKMLNVLPGITGLWQVSGRNDLNDDARFELDIFYIERWSLGLDLKIAFRTVPAMLTSRGAY